MRPQLGRSAVLELASRVRWGAVLVVWLTVASSVSADDEGGFVVCFEVPLVNAEREPTGDVDIHIERITPSGQRAWDPKGRGVPVVSSRLVEGLPAVCSDGAGGVIVVCTQASANGAQVNLVAQRVGPDGTRLWNDGKGARVVASMRGVNTRPALIADGRDGAILAHLWRAASGHGAVLVQRIDSDGNAVWNADEGGVVVAGRPVFDRAPVLVSDSDGGAIVLFEAVTGESEKSVWAQRVSKDGKALWREGRLPRRLCDAPHRERRVAAASDGAGGVIAAFEIAHLDGESAGRVDVGAQRLSATGEVLWGEGPDASGAHVSGDWPRAGHPVVVSDGSGGALLAYDFEMTTNEGRLVTGVKAQRLSPAGKVLWFEQGVELGSIRRRERRPAVAALPGGGVFVAFEAEQVEGTDPGQRDVRAQCVGADGTPLLYRGNSSAAVFVQEIPEHSPLAFADGRGGVVVIGLANLPPKPGRGSGIVALVAHRFVLTEGNELKIRHPKVVVGVTLGPEVHACAAPLEGP